MGHQPAVMLPSGEGNVGSLVGVIELDGDLGFRNKHRVEEGTEERTESLLDSL